MNNMVRRLIIPGIEGEGDSVMTLMEKLNQLFGPSSIILGNTDGIQVRLWPDAQCQGMGVICTMGMSDRVQPNISGCPSKEPRIELLCFCRLQDADILGQLLLDLSGYPFLHKKTLFWWQSLPLGRSLIPGSELCAIMLTFPPYSEQNVTFSIEGKRRDLVWVIPITKSELDFCRREGIEALEDRFESQNVDFANLFRGSLV